MLKADTVRLQHMVDAANQAFTFVAEKSRSELESDQLLALALIKLIEIFGEAASKITRETKSQSMEIPWADIIAMRNRLIHGYFDVNLDIIWRTVNEEMPPIARQIESLLSSNDLRN
jgi:uncharacterized protein with HEPN domain